jgi:hypothetical protein
LAIHVGDSPLRAAGVAEPGSFIVDRERKGGEATVEGPETRIYVNPGEYSVSLALESARQRHTVVLDEGAQVTLHWAATPAQALEPPDGSSSSPPTPGASGDGPTPRRLTVGSTRAGVAASSAREEGRPSVLDTAKVGSFVVAAGGFGLALGSGIVALSTGAHLDSVCPAPNACPAEESAAVERYQTSVKLTNAGLITGLAASAVGLGLTLFGKDRRTPSTSVSATLGGVEVVRAF